MNVLLLSAMLLLGGPGTVSTPLLCNTAVFAIENSSLDPLVLTEADLPEGYIFSDGDYTKSIQAALLYKSPDMYAALIGNVTEKRMQPIKGPDYENGTVLYMVFDKPVEAGFIKGLIWGGDAPTAEHPEELLIRDNVLVIVSFRQGSEAGQHIKDVLTQRL